MDQFYKKCDDDRRAIELENTKLKLKMVSRNSKLSKPSVDDYINNILGSGLKFNKPMHYNKFDSQSATNVHYNDAVYSHNNSNQSVNLQSGTHNGNNCHTERSVILPSLYKDVIDTVRLSSCELDTSKIYEIFITSGLSQDILGAIWSNINRKSPGKLTEQELITGLAMIALCQDQILNYGSVVNIKLPSWEHVVGLTDLPVPKIIINTKPKYTEENHILVEPVTITASTCIDEWADFADFVSTDNNYDIPKEIKSNKAEALSNDLIKVPELPTTNTLVPLGLDIGQEINNQFHNWHDNIHTDKSIRPNKPEDNSKHTGYGTVQNYLINVDHDMTNGASSIAVPYPATDVDFGDFQLFSTNEVLNSFVSHQNNPTAEYLDRYEPFNSNIKGPCDNLIEQWLRCLGQSLKILANTVSVLKQVDDEMIKVDVFNSEKGILLLKGIIEVYRVTRNIKLSASRSNILTSSKSMLDHLSDLEQCWNEFMLIIPDEMQIDVQSKLSHCSPYAENDSSSDDSSSLTIGCGVCLCPLDHDEGFLGHGLHRYHCPCANLWVNTLDLTLPGLTLPSVSALNLSL